MCHTNPAWAPPMRSIQLTLSFVMIPSFRFLKSGHLCFQGSSLSLSRSNSREGIGNGSDSENWRDRNGTGNGIGHSEFPSAVSSPKRKQNKSGLYILSFYKRHKCNCWCWQSTCYYFQATEHYLSSSNYMDCISSVTGSNGCSLNCSTKGSDLPELFSKLGLGKYTDVFQQQEVVWGLHPRLFLCLSNLKKNRTFSKSVIYVNLYSMISFFPRLTFRHFWH